MNTSSHALALDHGTLRLRLDIDLRTLAVGAAFLALLAVEAAVMLAASAYDAADQFLFTT